MADHWPFVVAAYGLAVVVFGGYWRRLVRRERELTSARSRPRARAGQPRLEPTARQPLR